MKIYFYTLGAVVAVVGVIACPETAGTGCALALAVFGAMMTATEMAIQGASLQQILVGTAIGLAAGYVGGFLGGALVGNGSLIASMAGGAIASMSSQVLTADITGQNLTFESLLSGAAMGAAMGAFQYEVTPTPVDQANVSASKGSGGTGAARLEKQETLDSVLASAGVTGEGSSDDDLLGAFDPNAQARARIADSASALAADGGAEYGTNNEYDGGTYTVAAGKYKCNIYVHDVLDDAGIPNKLMRANVWGNPDSVIPGFTQVDDYSDAEPGDVVAFQRYGDHHGHVGIIVDSGPPSALAASSDGVVSTGTFSAHHPNAGSPVVWRYTGN